MAKLLDRPRVEDEELEALLRRAYSIADGLETMPYRLSATKAALGIRWVIDEAEERLDKSDPEGARKLLEWAR